RVIIFIYNLLVLCYFFFFQAEDGIRDRNVTGVQTCALPISAGDRRARRVRLPAGELPHVRGRLHARADRARLPRCHGGALGADRSEERRVGKECRSWGWAEY